MTRLPAEQPAPLGDVQHARRRRCDAAALRRCLARQSTMSAGGRPEQARERAQQGALAGTVAAHQGHDRPRAHLQRRRLEHADVAVAHGEVLGPQQRRGPPAPSRTCSWPTAPSRPHVRAHDRGVRERPRPACPRPARRHGRAPSPGSRCRPPARAGARRSRRLCRGRGSRRSARRGGRARPATARPPVRPAAGGEACRSWRGRSPRAAADRAERSPASASSRSARPTKSR